MEWDLIWKAALTVLIGTFLLRIAGRKTISQMTLAETVIMIAIGSLLIQPVAGKNIWLTFLVGAVLVGTLITMEYIQVKSDFFEKLITGKSRIVIDNGQLVEKNLRNLRLTVDQLEMNLRQKNVTNISNVQYATLEPNGQIGITLKEEAQPVTKKEFKELVELLSTTNAQVALLLQDSQSKQQANQDNLFTEVLNKSHTKAPPSQLQ